MNRSGIDGSSAEKGNVLVMIFCIFDSAIRTGRYSGRSRNGLRPGKEGKEWNGP